MNKTILTSCILLISLLFSCDKIEDPTPDLSNQAVTDNNTSQTSFDDINTEVQSAFRVNDGNLRTAVNTTCASISFQNDGIAPDTMYIDFDGSTCSDLKQREGRLEIIYTGRYKDVGAVISTTPINYKVNGIAVEGSHTVTNKGKNNLNQTEFDISVKNGKVTYTDDTYTLWESERTRVWVEGESTTGLAFGDDVYEIYGSASGTDRDGITFTMTANASNPLRYEVACLLKGNTLATSGILTITPNNIQSRVVNYGDGECDYKINVGIGEFNIDIDLASQQ